MSKTESLEKEREIKMKVGQCKLLSRYWVIIKKESGNKKDAENKNNDVADRRTGLYVYWRYC